MLTLALTLPISLQAMTEHLIGVPPGMVKYEISLGNQSRSLQVAGTHRPASLVINGRKAALTKVKKTKLLPGVYVNNELISTKGSTGHFYKELDPTKANQKIVIVDKNTYEVVINSKKTFIEKSILKTIFFKKDETPKWSVSGVLPKGTELILNGKSLQRNKNDKVEVPLNLESGKHYLNLKIKEGNRLRTVYVPYKVSVKAGSKNESFLTIETKNNKGTDTVWDVPYYGLRLNAKSRPGTEISVGKQMFSVGENGNSDVELEFDCNKKVPDKLLLQINSLSKKNTYLKKIKSSACKRYVEKNNSRIYFGLGFGHVGLVFPQAGSERTLYSKHIGVGPRFSLGIRLYKKWYFEVRGFKTQSFHNSKGDYLSHLGGGGYWLGYPYRGKVFAAVGFMNYSPSSYRIGDDPNFFGFNNKRATTMALEGGYRWFVTPSWALNTRLTWAPKFLSFQSQGKRQWPFLILEPFAMEYHF